jgi:hypothetical protein
MDAQAFMLVAPWWTLREGAPLGTDLAAPESCSVT